MITTGVLYALTAYIHLWYMFSSLVATVASATGNFLPHKYFTYRRENSPKLLQEAPRIRELL
jgi:putative flippase GtrA